MGFTPSRDQLVNFYRTMSKIRLYEETLREAYKEGKSPLFSIAAGPIPGEMHLAAGQEPVAVGVCAHLRPDDTITAPHRPHHIAIAKGVNLKAMTAEIFGKKTGLGQGKGGHMHLFDPNVKFGCSGIVASGIPIAVGAALASKMKGKDSVAVAFFGEGAANSGAFHESINLASLWKLPVVFVCEDNSYAISVPKSKSTSIPNNSDRASSYGIPGTLVRDNDVVAVYEAAGMAVDRARKGMGPSLIEVKTSRFWGHFEGDPEVYRSKEEVERMIQNDPIKKFKQQLIERKLLTEQDSEAIIREARREVDDAMTFARQSPYAKPEEALLHVFV